MSLLPHVFDRRPVLDHDGRSGAAIETGRLADGTRVFVKHTPITEDLAALLTGNGHRELDLWEAGVFDLLPAGVEAAVLAVAEQDGTVVTISRDVSDAILRWDRILDPGEVERIFSAIAAVHERFADDPPAGLCPLETRLSLFAPDRLTVLATANAELAAAVRRGHELFDDLVPADVAAAVTANRADPGPLATALAKAGTTLLHGDFWLVNLAVTDTSVIALDWGLATDGPPAVDLVGFCVGAMANVAMGRDDLLGLARRRCGRFADDDVFALAELWALLELGWNKALDAVDHPDPAKRARERGDLEFWVGRARAALDRGLL